MNQEDMDLGQQFIARLYSPVHRTIEVIGEISSLTTNKVRIDYSLDTYFQETNLDDLLKLSSIAYLLPRTFERSECFWSPIRECWYHKDFNVHISTEKDTLL